MSNKYLLHLTCLVLVGHSLSMSGSIAADDQVSSKAPPLSPADSIATMEIAEGYSLTPVLSEPQIHEPSAIAWDGNGRMYVVEMRTYMQDIDGNDQLTPTSRVSRHEDTDGDGVYDKHTVFADNLILPRMVLPLIDKVIIRETNTFDLKSYQDTDGDGVADKIEMWHQGGPRGGNLEHQPSGLIWNIDNWLYTTYSRHRYRFSDGQVVRQSLPHGSGQWGLTHDNEGRIFYSTAGGEDPAMDFQRPIIYGRISLPGEQARGFRECFPIDNVPDVQGGRGRVRQDNTLNQFSGCCGQSIFRGTGMPAEFDGDLIIPEPVGRLIRRAKVTNDAGRIVVSNAYENKEFIAARDPNFRPVNSATGPDGCLYIVDMYRGIIQEGNWLNKGSYLRDVVQEYELDKNIGRGRIYRVDHHSTQRGTQPRMLDETPAELVSHLSHDNGWWRSEAQKLIVLHADPSVVPAVTNMLESSAKPLGRLHALWTLEGLVAITPSSLRTAFADSNPSVRAAALRICEETIADDRQYDDLIDQAAGDSDPNVVIQTVLSVSRGNHPNANQIIQQIEAAHPKHRAIQGIIKQIRTRIAAMIAERQKLDELRRRNKLLAESVVRGKMIYSTLCVTCHGENGRGVASPDTKDMLVAPSLVQSPRVTGHKARLTRILLHGLMGKIDDKTYTAGLMLPMGSNPDPWISDVATYIRNSWGNEADLVEPTDVARIREESRDRIGPWTLRELTYFDPPLMEDRSMWKLTASHNPARARGCIDGDVGSRWDTNATQKPGMWLGIELPEPIRLMSLRLDTQGSSLDYPRGYSVKVSVDGQAWSEEVAKGTGENAVTEIEIDRPEPVRFVRITQTGFSPNKFWSIHELGVKGLSLREPPPASLAQELAKRPVSELARLSRDQGNAERGATIFFNAALSCVKCHEPRSGDRLGPDLASKRTGVTDAFLIDALLDPSKDIREEFQQYKVLTEAGLLIVGFLVSETDDTLVLKEPAGGKIIELDQDDVVAAKPTDVSAMPPGLINQLADEDEFFDLMRFLMEVNDGGRTKLESLQP